MFLCYFILISFINIFFNISLKSNSMLFFLTKIIFQKYCGTFEGFPEPLLRNTYLRASHIFLKISKCSFVSIKSVFSQFERFTFVFTSVVSMLCFISLNFVLTLSNLFWSIFNTFTQFNFVLIINTKSNNCLCNP